MAVVISATVSTGVHVPFSVSVFDFRSLVSFASVEKSAHCFAFVPLYSGLHKINFATSDNNVTFILTLLCDLIFFLRTLTPLG